MICSNYGSFSEQARLSQELKFIASNSPAWVKMRPYQREGLEMILHKISRILNGNPDYIDSYVAMNTYNELIKEV